MKYRIILGILITLSAAGCYNRDLTPRLDEAEALLLNNPDSALTLLQQLNTPQSSQSNQGNQGNQSNQVNQSNQGTPAEKARYALLYSEALDRNEIKVTNDSLIRIAWNYYKDHPKNLREQCKVLYYWGRIKLDAGDKPGALRLFLEIEEKLKNINEPYYMGLLYSQIGEVYYTQMNYSRAYHNFREARSYFRQANHLREETASTLDMAAATYHSKDIDKAMRLYSAALDLADEQKSESLSKASLTNLASLYVISGKRHIPQDLLQRIETSARQDTSYGYHTLVDVHLLKNQIDSARYYLELAKAHTTDVRDMAELQYTAYRIEALSKNFEKATDNIHRYIYLTDSLTRSNMQFSAGMVEREYFKEQSAFAEYRMKNRTVWESVIILIVLLLAGITYYIIRQRMRLQRERTDHYFLLAEEANSEYKALRDRIEGQHSSESHLKELIASRFEIIDKLGKTYYERENTSSQQVAMFQEVKQIITDFSENKEILQELELIVNTCHDNAMQKLRNDFPAMKDADIRLLCYIFVGFSPQVISLFMKDTVANIYARKSRLKSRIKSARTDHKELFLSLFE